MRNSKLKKYKKRKFISLLALVLSFFSMIIGIIWLFWILFDVVHLGLINISRDLFTQALPPPSATSGGGLANAIVGSLLMVLIASIIGSILGIMTAIYLNEYGKSNTLAKLTSFINDILLSAPSIILGLFVYTWFVVPFKGFSGWAGVAALSLIVMPVVIRTTENILSLIPNNLREAAYALGCPKWKVVTFVVIRSAKSAIITGLLLAVARISGETAPLLFTSLSNQHFNSDLTEPMASLPVVIYQFAMSPYENWRNLAWAGVFIISITVLGLNIISRLLTSKKSR